MCNEIVWKSLSCGSLSYLKCLPPERLVEGYNGCDCFSHGGARSLRLNKHNWIDMSHSEIQF